MDRDTLRGETAQPTMQPVSAPVANENTSNDVAPPTPPEELYDDSDADDEDE